jgi:hypothetical protein
MDTSKVIELGKVSEETKGLYGLAESFSQPAKGDNPQP